jgi:hypothetical protein
MDTYFDTIRRTFQDNLQLTPAQAQGLEAVWWR